MFSVAGSCVGRGEHVLHRIYETSLFYAKHVSYRINQRKRLAEKFRIYETFGVYSIRNKFRIYVTCIVYTKGFRPQVRSLFPVERSFANV